MITCFNDTIYILKSIFIYILKSIFINNIVKELNRLLYLLIITNYLILCIFNITF